MREHLVKMLNHTSDFYLSEWAREGYSADSRAAINTRLQALKVSQDPNPELDKQIVNTGNDIGICLVRRRS
jgi:hypothetical protein